MAAIVLQVEMAHVLQMIMRKVVAVDMMKMRIQNIQTVTQKMVKTLKMKKTLISPILTPT